MKWRPSITLLCSWVGATSRCDLVWATAWMGDANDVIAPLLGLPRLPVADLPEHAGDDGPQWKTQALVRVAQGRPFVWLDDVIGPVDRWRVELEHPGQALLHQVDHRVGLTTADLDDVAKWLGNVS